MANKKSSAKRKITKKVKKKGHPSNSKKKELKPKRTRVSKEDLKEKEEKVNPKKSSLLQNKKQESFDKSLEESNPNSNSFFGKIFSIFKKKKVERDFKKEELKDARKKLESELGEKLGEIHKRDYSKNPINFDDNSEGEKKEKVIDKKTIFSKLKKTSLGQVFSDLDSKRKKTLKKKLSSLNFSTYSEFEEAVVSNLSDLLMDSYTEISNKINELIKSGGEAGKLGLELMEIPLKVNLFKTTKSKKDFEKIEDMIKSLNNGFLKMEEFSEKQKKKSIYSIPILSGGKSEEETIFPIKEKKGKKKKGNKTKNKKTTKNSFRKGSKEKVGSNKSKSKKKIPHKSSKKKSSRKKSSSKKK